MTYWQPSTGASTDTRLRRGNIERADWTATDRDRSAPEKRIGRVLRGAANIESGVDAIDADRVGTVRDTGDGGVEAVCVAVDREGSANVAAAIARVGCEGVDTVDVDVYASRGNCVRVDNPTGDAETAIWQRGDDVERAEGRLACHHCLTAQQCVGIGAVVDSVRAHRVRT